MAGSEPLGNCWQAPRVIVRPGHTVSKETRFSECEGKKRSEVKQAEHQEKVAIGNTGCPKKRYKLNAAGVTVHRSPVAGIPYFWKLLFWLVSY